MAMSGYQMDASRCRPSALRLLGASLASQVGMVGPLSTMWMAAWWLDEPVSWRLMLGTAAVLAGIVVLSKSSRPQAAPAPEPVRASGGSAA